MYFRSKAECSILLGLEVGYSNHWPLFSQLKCVAPFVLNYPSVVQGEGVGCRAYVRVDLCPFQAVSFKRTSCTYACRRRKCVLGWPEDPG